MDRVRILDVDHARGGTVPFPGSGRDPFHGGYVPHPSGVLAEWTDGLLRLPATLLQAPMFRSREGAVPTVFSSFLRVMRGSAGVWSWILLMVR
ncbi:MAG: hypothetical protein ACYCYP_10890 [Leptospirales bacterium]